MLPLTFSASWSNNNASQFSGERRKIVSLYADDGPLSFFFFIHHSVFWLSRRLFWPFSLCFQVFILFVLTPSSPISRLFVFPSSQTWLSFSLLFWSYSWNTLCRSVLWFALLWLLFIHGQLCRRYCSLTHHTSLFIFEVSLSAVNSGLSQPDLCLMTHTILNPSLRPVT